MRAFARWSLFLLLFFHSTSSRSREDFGVQLSFIIRHSGGVGEGGGEAATYRLFTSNLLRSRIPSSKPGGNRSTRRGGGGGERGAHNTHTILSHGIFVPTTKDRGGGVEVGH